MTPPCSPVFPAAVIARLDSTETHRPFDADEEDRRNDEDDEQEELERQERQDEEDGEDRDELFVKSGWKIETIRQLRSFNFPAGSFLRHAPARASMFRTTCENISTVLSNDDA